MTRVIGIHNFPKSEQNDYSGYVSCMFRSLLFIYFILLESRASTLCLPISIIRSNFSKKFICVVNVLHCLAGMK